MYLYFLLIRIAALFGHKKARLLVKGQAETLCKERKDDLAGLQGAVWIHAASVGEFEQARPLIERIKEADERTKVVVTFFSPSGYEARKNYELADGIYYLPFATRRNARRFIEAIEPKMAVFVKYEFWPAYLRALKKRNIPTYCISAIFRPTQRFFQWWGKGALRLLKCFTHIYVQDESSMRLLTEHGIRDCSIAGDTRFDRMAQVKAHGATVNGERLTPVAQFAENSGQVIVAGSTWPEDEELLKEYIENTDPEKRIKLILVPHELDEQHLHFIFNLFQGRMVKYSAVSTMPSDMNRLNILQHAQVLLIDTIGLLSSIYRFGQVAYIGGGFGVGIHNTIEAAAYGMPVIFGPNYHHFREAQGLIDAGAAVSITNAAEMETAFNNALDNYSETGAKAAAYVQSELGATEKIYHSIYGTKTKYT